MPTTIGNETKNMPGAKEWSGRDCQRNQDAGKKELGKQQWKNKAMEKYLQQLLNPKQRDHTSYEIEEIKVIE